jgi:hypothetical protein
VAHGLFRLSQNRADFQVGPRRRPSRVRSGAPMRRCFPAGVPSDLPLFALPHPSTERQSPTSPRVPRIGSSSVVRQPDESAVSNPLTRRLERTCSSATGARLVVVMVDMGDIGGHRPSPLHFFYLHASSSPWIPPAVLTSFFSSGIQSMSTMSTKEDLSTMALRTWLGGHTRKGCPPDVHHGERMSTIASQREADQPCRRGWK